MITLENEKIVIYFAFSSLIRNFAGVLRPMVPSCP